MGNHVRPQPQLNATDPRRRVTRAKAARLAVGMSQRELSRRTGLARETIRRCERGQGATHLATAKLIANELGLPLGALFGTSAADRSEALEALREAAER